MENKVVCIHDGIWGKWFGGDRSNGPKFREILTIRRTALKSKVDIVADAYEFEEYLGSFFPCEHFVPLSFVKELHEIINYEKQTD